MWKKSQTLIIWNWSSPGRESSLCKDPEVEGRKGPGQMGLWEFSAGGCDAAPCHCLQGVWRHAEGDLDTKCCIWGEYYWLWVGRDQDANLALLWMAAPKTCPTHTVLQILSLLRNPKSLPVQGKKLNFILSRVGSWWKVVGFKEWSLKYYFGYWVENEL